MEITDIVVRQLQSTGKLKAVVSVTFDNCFVVHDVKVIESMNGLFIAMPSRKTPNNNYIDIVHPINSAFRQVMSDAVLGAYRALLEEEDEDEDWDDYDDEDEDEGLSNTGPDMYYGDRPAAAD